MNPFRFHDKKGHFSLGGRWVGLLGVGLIALLVWLTADPAAHERFHSDAGGGDHHCVVTDYAAGEAYFLAPTVVVRPDETIAEIISCRAIEALREQAAYVLLPSRGPPASALRA